MKYHIRFYKSESFWLAFCDEVPGAMTQGKTIAEARLNIKDAIKLMLKPIEPEELKLAEKIEEVIAI